MKIISIINLKGGVAKTLTADNMAHVLAVYHKKRVFLIDNDKQGNTSKMFGVHSYDDKSISDVLAARRLDIHEAIKKTRFADIDVLPANMTLIRANLEVMMDSTRPQQTRLRAALDPIAGEYDYCLIDNAPDINISTINALVASDDVIIPIKIDKYALPDFSTITVKAPAGAATRPAEPPTTSTGSNDTQGAAMPVVGDVVHFKGTRHFLSANANGGFTCKPGTAKVTQLAPGTKHPVHLIAQSGGGSTVYGWVDLADIQGATSAGTATAPKMRVGARVKYSGPLYRDSNGNGQGMDVNGTYTVKYYYPGRKCGVHVDGLGWVPESACSVVG